MSKQDLAKALGAVGAGFGVLSVLAPRTVAKVYGVPVTPGGVQLQRLFGSRSLALAVLMLTAASDEETDRGLLVLAGSSALDSLTALASAGSNGGRTTVSAVLSSLFQGGAALAIRSMKG
jgi:hypothetical protein